jgi:UDP-GlcNAc:undecaprenyl-phosphate/decaprenyl-phosphate GlcNAc-1-phosphate transferase
MLNAFHTIHFYGWFNGFIAFCVSVFLLPVVCGVTRKWQLLDPPGSLKIHTVPISRLGGIAIGIGIAVGISIGGMAIFSKALGLYFALLLVWVVGLVDDLRPLSPSFRLVAQICAGLLISVTPWRVSVFGNVLVDTALTCAFVLVFVNSFNFLDGADGLAAGVAGLVGLGYVLLYSMRAHSIGGAIAWSLLGSCVAFLFFNFPPAKIFMGDSGSTVLGLVVALLGLDFYRVHHAVGTHWLLPLVFAGLPVLDFLLAVVRRLRKRTSPLSGDRKHLYDLLREQGWAARSLALSAYLATGILLLGGALCDQPNWLFSIFALCLLFGYMVFAAIRLGALR